MSGSKGSVGRPTSGAPTGRAVYSATPGAGPGDFDADSLSSIPSDFTPWPGGPRGFRCAPLLPRVRAVSKGSSSTKSKKSLSKISSKKSNTSGKSIKKKKKKKVLIKKGLPKPRRSAVNAKAKTGKVTHPPTKKSTPKTSPVSSKSSTKPSRSPANIPGPKPSPVREALSNAGSNNSSNKSRVPSTSMAPSKQIVQMLIQTQARLLHREPAASQNREPTRASSGGKDSPGHSKERIRTSSASKSQTRDHSRGYSAVPVKDHSKSRIIADQRKENAKSHSAPKVKEPTKARSPKRTTRDQSKMRRRSLSAGQMKEKQRDSSAAGGKDEKKESLQASRGSDTSLNGTPIKRLSDTSAPRHVSINIPIDISQYNEKAKRQLRDVHFSRQPTRKYTTQKSSRHVNSNTCPLAVQREKQSNIQGIKLVEEVRH